MFISCVSLAEESSGSAERYQIFFSSNLTNNTLWENFLLLSSNSMYYTNQSHKFHDILSSHTSTFQQGSSFTSICLEGLNLQFQVANLFTGFTEFGVESRIFFFETGNGRILRRKNS